MNVSESTSFSISVTQKNIKPRRCHSARVWRVSRILPPPNTPNISTQASPSISIDTEILILILTSKYSRNTMASGQPFASRSYAGTKLPDRSVNTNAMPFSASSFSRHRGLGNTAQGDFAEAAKQQQPAPATNAQSHGPAQDANPLNRLTEEQREEINEAVREFSTHLFFPLPRKRNSVNKLMITSSLSLISTATATLITTSSVSPSEL